MRRLIASTVLWLPLAFVFDGLGALLLPVRLSAEVPAEALGTATGGLSTAGLLTALAMLPLAGWLSDRSRDHIGRLTAIAIAVGALVVSLALLAGARGISLFALGWIAVHASAGALAATISPLVPEFVPRAARGRASGVKGVLDLGGSFVAFVVLGALLAGGHVIPALALMAAVAIGAFVLTALPLRGVGLAVEADRPRDVIDSRPALVTVALSRLLFLAGIYAVGRFLVVLIAERLGVDPASAADEAGGLLAALALLAAIVSLPAGWASDRWGRRAVIVTGAGIGVVGALTIPAVGGLFGIALGGVLLSFASALFATGNWALATDVARPERAGRHLSGVNAATLAAGALAGIAGPLFDTGNAIGPGIGTALLAGAAALAMGAAGLVTMWPVERRRTLASMEAAR